MNFSDIITEIQECIILLQLRLDELRSMDTSASQDIMLTRQEAADLLGKSLRQLDRDCTRYFIKKEQVNGGIRIRKSELMKYMGLLGAESAKIKPQSDFHKIYNRLR